MGQRQRQRWTNWWAAAVAIGVAAAGCAEGDTGPIEDTVTRTGALITHDWRNWSLYQNYPSDNIQAGPPALCSNRQFLSMVGVRRGVTGSDFYYFHTIQSYLSSAWQALPGGSPSQPQNVKFLSPPTCTMLHTFPDSDDPTKDLMVIAGKDENGRIRTILATGGGDPEATPDDPPPPPTNLVDGMWRSWNTLDSNYTYSETGQDGYPAIASKGSRAVLVFRAWDSAAQKQRIYAYYRTSTVWSSRITAPDLPSGAVAVGTPAITYITDSTTDNSYDNKFVIVTRIQGNYGLAHITFDGNNTWGTWKRPVMSASLVGSDPAVEWDPEEKVVTLYIGSTIGSLHQIKYTAQKDPASFSGASYTTVFEGDPAIKFEAPRATMGGGLENNRRMLIIRGYTSSVPIEDRNNSFLYTQDIAPLSE
jgi:hypothetical protein